MIKVFVVTAYYDGDYTLLKAFPNSEMAKNYIRKREREAHKKGLLATYDYVRVPFKGDQNDNK